MNSLRRLGPYFRRYKKKLILGLVIVTISNVFTVSVPSFARKALDALGDGSATTELLLTYGAMMFGATMLGGFFMFLTRQTIIVMSREIENDMRNDFLAHIQILPVQFFHDTPTGDIMAYSTNDIAAVRNFIGPCIMYTADTVTTFIFALAMMLSINTRLTLWALMPLPFVSFGVYYIGRRVYPLFTGVQEQFSEITTRAQESLSGIRVVRAYVRESFEAAQFKVLSWEYLRKNMKLIKIQGLMQPLMFMLVGLSNIIVLGVGAQEVMRHTLTVGGIVQFIMYLSILIWPMIAFGWVSNMVQRAAASMRRLITVLDMPATIADSSATDATITHLQGSVAFRNVTFQYPDRTEAALRDISFDVPAGTTVGILGTTGSGKTSLVHLLPRLYDPASGDVLIDGKSVHTIPLEVLRRDIAVVTQDPFLFSDTVRNNVAFARIDATQDEIVRAAEVAQLNADIAAFPKGFDTMIGERGITMSGGQKQRTAIARAVLCDPRILILDDALSAIDTHTEAEILKALREFMRSRTSIVIAHRISTVKNADIILVMDDGKIIERGTHDELLAAGGMYADVHERQLLEEELESL